jgi:predicted ATPase/class 3 adenylate cyclase
VTFLFTDIEGSTGQWEADASATEALVAAHDKLVRAVVEGHDGYVFATGGDGFAVAFHRASEGVAAAVELQETLTGEEWATSGLGVRTGVHTGEAAERDGDYFGPTVNRAARIMALAHGGQILVSRAVADLVPEMDTLDLGEYRLRGLARPERLYQVIAAGIPREFPPLRGDQATAHNLPAPLTSFLGRQDEIDDLVARAVEGRLITLVGPGGAGKTRLAIETGRQLLDDFPDGVWLAELAALRNPAQVASTVAKAMGQHDPLAEDGGPTLVRDRLGAAIGNHRVLLVLDNCEHLVEAAADLTAGLLGLCSCLGVLATSRQSLGIAGEQLVEVGALDLPVGDDMARVAASAAGALFVQRAQAVHPGFQLDEPTAAAVAEVCRRLEGLPLAIELVAARARLLTAAQIAVRLEETLALPAGGRRQVERHQTMRAALAWSYDLLSLVEQDLFRRLAVFRSSFTLEAAAAVAPAVSQDILSVLGGLVDKSLVAVFDGASGERRFRLLEPVRQFASELLEVSGEQSDAGRRHRDHLQSRLAQFYVTPDSAAADGLAAEVDNMRAVVEHAMRTFEPEAATALILAYGPWWDWLGLVDERLDRLDAALALVDPDRMPLDALCDALFQASNTATQLGRVTEAAAFAQQLAQLRDQHPENLLVRGRWAFALGTLTSVRAGGDFSQAKWLMREAQRAMEASGLPKLASGAAGNIPIDAILWDSTDDPEVALAIRDCAQLSKASGAPILAMAMSSLFEGVIRVLGGSRDAYPSCRTAVAQLEGVAGGFLAASADLLVGLAAELVSDWPVCRARLLSLLRYCRRSEVRVGLTSGIRGAARLAANAGYPELALRLWGGAEHIEAVAGMQYLPLMERLDGPLRQQCTDAVGADAASLLAEGASWSVAEATQAAEEALLGLEAGN